MAKFVAPSKNLRLVMRPIRRHIIDGVSHQLPGEAIQFSNGVYETENEKELKFLRNHKVFNRDFFETKTQTIAERVGFECEVCGQVCSSKAGLSAHMRTHNKEGE